MSLFRKIPQILTPRKPVKPQEDVLDVLWAKEVMALMADGKPRAITEVWQALLKQGKPWVERKQVGSHLAHLEKKGEVIRLTRGVYKKPGVVS